jgi:hypothetical protein
MNSEYGDFGGWVKKQCHDLRVSLADLARESGVGYRKLSGASNGYWAITQDEESRIQSALKRITQNQSVPKTLIIKACPKCNIPERTIENCFTCLAEKSIYAP